MQEALQHVEDSGLPCPSLCRRDFEEGWLPEQASVEDGQTSSYRVKLCLILLWPHAGKRRRRSKRWVSSPEPLRSSWCRKGETLEGTGLSRWASHGRRGNGGDLGAGRGYRKRPEATGNRAEGQQQLWLDRQSKGVTEGQAEGFREQTGHSANQTSGHWGCSERRLVPVLTESGTK